MVNKYAVKIVFIVIGKYPEKINSLFGFVCTDKFAKAHKVSYIQFIALGINIIGEIICVES